MNVRFTHHAKQKIQLLQTYSFHITTSSIENILRNPQHIEDKTDGTHIAMSLYDDTHVLRIVYRVEHDIIIVITCYPGRRKAYDI